MKTLNALSVLLIALAPVYGADLVFKKTKIVHTTGEGEKEFKATVIWTDDHVEITPQVKSTRKKYPELTMSIPCTAMYDLEYSTTKHWRVAAALLGLVRI